MAQTTNYGLNKPAVSSKGWGDDVNANFDTIDTQLKANADAVNAIPTGGDVSGPASSTNNNVVVFNGTTGKIIKDSGVGISGSNTGDETAATIKTKLGITTLSGSNTGDQTLPVKATGAEADTGTDDAKFLTSKAAKDSHNIPSVAPSTSGNVLTSNGTDWVSSAPAASGATVSRGTFSKTNMTYTFTIATPSVSPTAGATYTNNTFTFTVVSYAANVLVCTGTGYPTASGTLTKASGTGDATLTFTAFTATYVVTHNLALSTSPYTVIVSFANGATNKAIGNVDDITFATNSMTFDTTSLGSIHTGTFGYAYIAG